MTATYQQMKVKVVKEQTEKQQMAKEMMKLTMVATKTVNILPLNLVTS